MMATADRRHILPVLVVLLLAIAGCALPGRDRAGPVAAAAVVVRTAEPASDDEAYCAWYGDAREGILYFGEAAFWSGLRATGDPTADLQVAGPQRVGRFDLRSEKMLEPLDVGGTLGKPPRSGVWDVLAHPNGRIYFTTYFEDSGYLEPASGDDVALPGLGVGLNELALGPDGSILATRYGAADGSGGSVVRFTQDGALITEHPLSAPPGWHVAPKSVAFDARRGAVWLTTDLVAHAGGGVRQDARVIDLEGRELARWEEPELQFMAFDAHGTGYLVERHGPRLTLRILDPADTGPLATAGRQVLLDDAFGVGIDFAQDLRIASDGRVVVTRWSGRIDVVDPAAPGGPSVRQLTLPGVAEGGLYYTAVLENGRICTTLCAGLTVVCAAAP
jgi:hypothetical protein